MYTYAMHTLLQLDKSTPVMREIGRESTHVSNTDTHITREGTPVTWESTQITRESTHVQ